MAAVVFKGKIAKRQWVSEFKGTAKELFPLQTNKNDLKKISKVHSHNLFDFVHFFIVLNWNAPQSLDFISKWRPSDSLIHTQIMQWKIVPSSVAQSLCKILINNRQCMKVAVN